MHSWSLELLTLSCPLFSFSLVMYCRGLRIKLGPPISSSCWQVLPSLSLQSYFSRASLKTRHIQALIGQDEWQTKKYGFQTTLQSSPIQIQPPVAPLTIFNPFLLNSRRNDVIALPSTEQPGSYPGLFWLRFPASGMFCPQISHFILPKGHFIIPSYKIKQIPSFSISGSFIFLCGPYRYLMVYLAAVHFCVYCLLLLLAS